FCLPWLYTVFELLGKFFGICRCFKSFTGKNCRSSMMTMTTFAGCWKTCDNDIRLKFSDYPNHVAENFIMIPELKGFIRAFCEAKIISSCKKLFCSIDSSCCEKFLRSDQSQFNSLLITDQ